MEAELRDRLQTSLGSAIEVGRELGGGGMSRVFVADDRTLGRTIVIKVLPADMAATVNLERFKQEIRLAARLQHPHIVPLLSAGEVDGLPYFTMPFVDGQSLRDKLAGGDGLPVAEAEHILREIATALGYAHGEGVVHRDVKPENVLLSGGIAMVTDFGIAKALFDAQRTPAAGKSQPLTIAGTAVGTPAYIAPEQAAGAEHVDHRADIYAWGALAYEMLTGAPPFAGRSVQATLAAHVTEAPAPILQRRPRLPAALAQLVMRSLEKRPADRPQSAAELVQGLDATAVPRHMSRRGMVWVAGGLAAVGLLALFAAPAIRRRFVDAPLAAAGDSTARSIAVLPFASTDGDTAHQYFADGITDELGTALGKVAGLRVISRRSAFAFEGKTASSRDIGRTLGASLLLDGTVRRAGNRVRVNPQLTNAADGNVLWTDRYEGDAKDVFALQDSIVQSIVGALRLAIGVGNASAAANSRTANLEAHDLYLQGKFEASKHSRAGLVAALDLFRRSSAKDPNYALPLVGTADAYGWLADDYIPAHEAYTRATAAVTRAIVLVPDLAEAHAVLSWIHYSYNWRTTAAAAEGRRAVALDPASALAHANYSYPLLSLGDSSAALAEMRRAVALEPLSAALSANLEWQLLMQGKYEDAIEQHRTTQALDPTYFFADSWAATAYRELGKYDEARRLNEQAQGLQGGRPLPGLAITYVRMGDTVRARQLLGDLLAQSRKGFVKPEGIAQVYAALGDRNAAFAWLDTAFKNRSNTLPWLGYDPAFASLRSDPRFRGMLARIAADTLPAH